MKEPSEKIQRLTELIVLDPRNPELLVERGYAWQEADHFDRALADFERAVEVDPFCVNGLTASANLRFSMGDYDGAISDSSRAVGIEPDNVVALCTRAASYLKNGQPERALDGFERVLKLAPGQRGALQWRAVAKEALGDVEGARKDHAMSLSMKPPLMPE